MHYIIVGSCCCRDVSIDTVYAHVSTGGGAGLLDAIPQLATINGQTMQIFHVQSVDAMAPSQTPKEWQLVQSGTKVYQLVSTEGMSSPDVCSVISLNQAGEVEVLDQTKQGFSCTHTNTLIYIYRLRNTYTHTVKHMLYLRWLEICAIAMSLLQQELFICCLKI